MRHKGWREILSIGLAQLGFDSYRAYLASEHWQSVRRRFYKSRLYEGCCHACRRPDVPLQIHHKTYKHLGRERLTDLCALCGDCHHKSHEAANSSRGTSLRSSSRKIRNRFRRKARRAQQRGQQSTLPCNQPSTLRP